MTRSPRPRDRFGRPLERDSGVPVEPDPVPLPPDQSLHLAQALLDDGRAFRAHEVLEAIWKNDDTPTRDMWRGLAQLAVGVTHAQRGNATGAVALLRRSADTLSPWAGQKPHSVDVDAVRLWALQRAQAIEASDGLKQTAELSGLPRLSGRG